MGIWYIHKGFIIGLDSLLELLTESGKDDIYPSPPHYALKNVIYF